MLSPPPDPTELDLPPGTTLQPAIPIDTQTDSNHDTALTLAAHGGHDELTKLLITHGASIEHKDKKGEHLYFINYHLTHVLPNS